jgi:tetratricopeptide (TPR) repeat protein
MGEPITAAALDALWDFGDPAASEERFRAALDRNRATGGELECEILTQLARAQGLLRRFDDARRTLEQAAATADLDRPRDRIRLQLEVGRVDNSSRSGDRGRASFVDAWETARTAGEDGLAVDAAHMLGIVEGPELARTWNERAMELARSSDDPTARRWVASLANNMGWAAHDGGSYEEALALFELALDERRARGEATPLRIARWSVARCLRSLGRVEEALAIQRELLTELESAAVQDGYVPEEIAECLLALGRPDEARPFFARAHAELSADAWFAEAEPDRLARLESLGRA